MYAIRSYYGRRFEAKVLTYALIAMGIILEAVFAGFAFMEASALQTQIAVALLQIAVFVFKLMLFNIFFIVVRNNFV